MASDTEKLIQIYNYFVSQNTLELGTAPEKLEFELHAIDTKQAKFPASFWQMRKEDVSKIFEHEKPFDYLIAVLNDIFGENGEGRKEFKKAGYEPEIVVITRPGMIDAQLNSVNNIEEATRVCLVVELITPTRSFGGRTYFLESGCVIEPLTETTPEALKNN